MCTACKTAEAEGGGGVIPVPDDDQLARIRNAVAEAVRVGVAEALRQLADELEAED